MKINFLLAAFCGALLLPVSLYADPVQGESLNIYTPYEPNSLSGYQSAVIGASNSVSLAYYSLVLGSSHQFSYVGSGSLVAGMANTNVGIYGINSSLVSGVYNTVSGNTIAVLGSYNSVTAGNNGLVSGINNVVSGQQHVLGRGLIAQNTTVPAVVVGRYNVAITSPPTGQPSQVFVVGVGTNAQNPKNGLEVYSDGQVVLPKRQGDVGMGRFTTITADQ